MGQSLHKDAEGTNNLWLHGLHRQILHPPQGKKMSAQNRCSPWFFSCFVAASLCRSGRQPCSLLPQCQTTPDSSARNFVCNCHGFLFVVAPFTEDAAGALAIDRLILPGTLHAKAKPEQQEFPIPTASAPKAAGLNCAVNSAAFCQSVRSRADLLRCSGYLQKGRLFLQVAKHNISLLDASPSLLETRPGKPTLKESFLRGSCSSSSEA